MRTPCRCSWAPHHTCRSYSVGREISVYTELFVCLFVWQNCLNLGKRQVCPWTVDIKYPSREKNEPHFKISARTDSYSCWYITSQDWIQTLLSSLKILDPKNVFEEQIENHKFFFIVHRLQRPFVSLTSWKSQF